MPRYQHIDYDNIAAMVLKVTEMKGQPQLLKDLVSDMSRSLNLGVDTKKVFKKLGYHAKEEYEDIPILDENGNQVDTVRKVTTWVIP